MTPRRKKPTVKALHARAAPFGFGHPATAPCWLIIMAKQPVMGAVKSRLARQAGAPAAVRFYRHAVRTVTHRLGADPRWRTLLAVAPKASLGARVWPSGVGRIAQVRGDLGQRMQHLLEAPPPGRVIVIGTDIPDIALAHIARAFQLLGRHDAVLGPAEDGGFWLVGLRRVPRVLRPFEGVRWSAPQTLADTLANLAGTNLAGTRVAFAATLSDVDTAGDLARLGPAAARVVARSI